VYYDDAASGALPSGSVYVLHVDTTDGSLVSGDSYAPGKTGSHVSALSLLPDGGLLLGGYASRPADFGGGVLSGGVGPDPFALRLDAAVAHQWSTFLCATGSADVSGAGHDGSSPVLLVEYGNDLTLGAKQQTGYGSVLLDMNDK